MKATQKTLLVLFVCLTSCTICLAGGRKDYYNKHLIIVIDQTPDVQHSTGLLPLYGFIKELLKGKNPEGLDSTSEIPNNFQFDEQADEISLFAFGIGGTWKGYEGDYGRIYRRAQMHALDIDKVFEEVSSVLIHKRATLHTSGKSLDDFLETELKPMCNQQDVLYEAIHESSGVTLSHYVYPCILKYMDTSVMSTEYFIVIISNYKSGIYNNSDAADRERLYDFLNRNYRYVQAFEKEINALKSPFYTLDFLSLQQGPFSNRVVAKGMKVGLKSLQGVSVYAISNVDIKQIRYQGDEYTLKPVEIAFIHDSLLEVNKIELKISNEAGKTLLHQTIADNSITVSRWFNEIDKRYSLPEMIVSFANSSDSECFEAGDKITFEYVFYTMAKDGDGGPILPFAFNVERDYVFSSEVFKSAPDTQIALYVIIGLLTMSLILFFLRERWKSNGKKRKVSIDYIIWPITSARFMDVTDNKAISLDCWYIGKDEKSKNIFVNGRFIKHELTFAKQYGYSVQYSVWDNDHDENFTFAPDGQEWDGQPRRKGKYYDLPLDQNGKFGFNIKAYIEEGCAPSYEKDTHILKLLVIFKVLRKDKNEPVVFTTRREYSFIVRPQFDKAGLWMAFDLGTTGSCAAYGFGGQPTDTDNIQLAKNRTGTLTGESEDRTIFPSKIRIEDEAKIFTSKVAAETMEENIDFIFGNEAEMKWGSNSFQSIKKLLGYRKPQPIRNKKGEECMISGQDLAHLLVKGLYNHFREFIQTHELVDPLHRDLFIDKYTGEFSPRRAIVAVPNNYTMVKIQEMVDSVKRLGVFKEVHYLYESEGVMMTYFRQNWATLVQKQHKLFIVFDMGGATINITAFQMKLHLEYNKHSEFIRTIDLETVAKVGYCVGGDDIDYALIQFLFAIPAVKGALASASQDARELQHANKKRLIEFVRSLKLDWIEKVRRRTSSKGSKVNTFEIFGIHVKQLFKEMKVEVKTLDKEDKAYVDDQILKHGLMEAFVFSKLRDAVQELLTSISCSKQERSYEVELIMSGRSVLYPGIKENVLAAFGKSYEDVQFNCQKPWDGFNNADGIPNDELVKTAVATGACWYAMFSNKINMKHDLVTSTFGYIDLVDHKQRFIPMIERNSRFNASGMIKGNEKVTDPTLNDVKFVQMLGSDYEMIWRKKDDLKHKYNVIDQVTAEFLPSTIKEIEIMVDDKNNFDYSIALAGCDQPVTKRENKYSRMGEMPVVTEITDENSEAFAFAAVAVTDEVFETIKMFEVFGADKKLKSIKRI